MIEKPKKGISIAVKLRNAIIGTGLCVSVILVLLVTVQKIWMLNQFEESIREESEESKRHEQVLFNALEEEVMASYANVSAKYFDGYFKNIRRQTSVIASMMPRDPQGSHLQTIMEQMEFYDRKTNEGWLVFFIIRKDGTLLRSSEESINNGPAYPNLGQEPWFKKVERKFYRHKKRQFYWSGVHPGKVFHDRRKVTCACPYTDVNGQFAGVVAASVDVTSFWETLKKFDDKERTAIAIYDRSGEKVGVSNNYKVLDNHDGAKIHWGEYEHLDDVGIIHLKMKETKWTICLEQSRKEQFQIEDNIQRDFENFATDVLDIMQNGNLAGVAIILVLMVVAIIIMRFVAQRISESITRPLTRMVEQVESFGEDNDFAEVDVEYDDEIGQLGMAFNRMVAKLRDYLDHIRVISRDNERMESERSLVRQIQQNMLPNIFPAFPDRKELDIYASLLPASEGGGTFYDFFFIDRMTFCISIGEASGNGLLSTMFALVAKTVIKSYALQGYGTDRILAEANNQIAYGNEEGIVAHVFVGIVHLATGEMEYSMGGEAPVQWKHSGEALKALPDLQGVTLGNMENVPYKKKRILLSQGDLLFAHTKDTSECEDTHGSIYTAEYLYEKLADLSATDYRITPLLDALNDDIKTFTTGTRRKEDATMLMFRFWG